MEYYCDNIYNLTKSIIDNFCSYHVLPLISSSCIDITEFKDNSQIKKARKTNYYLCISQTSDFFREKIVISYFHIMRRIFFRVYLYPNGRNILNYNSRLVSYIDLTERDLPELQIVMYKKKIVPQINDIFDFLSNNKEKLYLLSVIFSKKQYVVHDLNKLYKELRCHISKIEDIPEYSERYINPAIEYLKNLYNLCNKDNNPMIIRSRPFYLEKSSHFYSRVRIGISDFKTQINNGPINNSEVLIFNFLKKLDKDRKIYSLVQKNLLINNRIAI